ncbi:Rhamnogalacturonate lyase precursor [Mariniflexile rhizosphaerae]|uniref:polysaccharide lyase family protein n=1 Tax=unclassified Mariniflexile TaxID=2643887 RepID=UPI000CAA5A1B|nr:polysaccharide lyase family protein [Mariniflexile sp. TRM1-10]AXP80170.1 Rhamnogalacturonate lyase precursor [Mariniflexile sp. TRM1-10]PLB19274.1 MAG: Rhamnogalacturonate lyase [Flavobacteriaceae bacterium FS1-H7996/R]
MTKQLKSPKLLSYITVFIFFSFTHSLFAQTNWIGAVDTDFYNANNWSNTAIDFTNIQSETLVIGVGSPNNPIQTGGNAGNINYRPGRLNISQGANAIFNGILLPWNNDYLNGTITLNAPADLNFRSAVYLGKATDGIINLNGGNLHSRFQFYIGYDTGGNGTVNVLGGTLYVGTYLEVGTSPNGTNPTGVLTIDGGTVEVPSGVNIGTNGSIHIANLGALIITGDHTTTINNYISNGKITSPVSTTLAVTFDGSKTTVAISQNPNSLITEYASYIILDSGPLQAKIDKATSNIQSLIVNGKETVATSNPANSGRVGTYYDFTGSYGFDKISGTVFSIKEETEDYIDVSFKRTYSDGTFLAPCDADIHYVLKKNDTGIYTYSILTHKAEYPDFDLGSWRQVLWLGNDGTNYLTEKIYVTEQKSWQMPSVFDFQNASSTPIQEIVKLNTGVRAGKYDGKYEYCENLYDLPVWGHASDVNSIGTWAVFGSHEFFPAGPTSHDLNAAAGIIHIDMTNVHYNSRGFNIPQGEEWSKIYGPYLWYTSEKPTGDENWADAKARAAQERAEWPYAWLTNTPEYPLADGRGNIVGNFSITDSEKPEIDGGNAWIGVTQLLPESDGDWQFEDRSYQYWVKTDASGNFDIKHIRPGTYTLFAFKTGEIDEYRIENVTVTAGGTTNLGNINWTIPRNNGNLVWDIGIPDRTAGEYKFGDFDYCEGYVEDKFESTFPNPIEYNVADKNWSTALPYVHSRYYKSDGNEDIWDWNINFNLEGNIPTTGNAKLTIAFASVDRSRFDLYVNGTRITPSTYYPNVPDRGNAFIRQSNHAKYGIDSFNIPYSNLNLGANTFTFVMPSSSFSSHMMYDYISLEGNLTATLDTHDFDKNDLGIKIFPNPASESIHVKIENENFDSLTLSVYDLLGKQLIKTTPIKSISNTYSIDIKNKLVSGIYIVKIDTEKGNYTSKIVIK